VQDGQKLYVRHLALNLYICVVACVCVVDRERSGESVALLVARRTNNRKVVGSRPTKVVCITVLRQVTAWGELSAMADRHSFLRAVGGWSLDCQR